MLIGSLPERPGTDGVLLDLVEAELRASIAAELGGGGSPCWGHTDPGEAEELAIAVEVARAVKDHHWPPLNPYPGPTSQS